MSEDDETTEVELRDDGKLHVDKTPGGHPQEASQQASGEVFTEYGIMDITSTFPAESYEWQGEFPPEEVTPEDREKLADAHDDLDPESNHAVASASREDHVVVPVRVVRRGFKRAGDARRVSNRMNDDEGHERYRPVLLSDTRGL